MHALLSGFLRIWALKNDEKSDPLKGACTDTQISVHALLCGGHLMRGKWVDIKFLYIWALMSGLNGQTELKKGNKCLKHTNFSSKSVFFAHRLRTKLLQ